MSLKDIFAIFRTNDGYAPAFRTDGKWWTVEKHGGGVWNTDRKARNHLRRAKHEYRHKYGEDLGWDVDGAPTVDVRK